MLHGQTLLRALAGAALISGAWGQEIVQAGKKGVVPAAVEAKPAKPPAAKEAEAPPPEEIKAALKGFRGFIVGEIVGKSKTGIVLRIRAITLLKGCTAPNPSLALGQTTPVLYVTEKDGAGNQAPAENLLEAIERIEQMPAFALGGFGGENAVVFMHWGQKQGLRWAARTEKTVIRDPDVRVGGRDEDDDDADDDEKDKAKTPVVTARILANDDGDLVMDRVMPGGQSYATWNGVPTLHFAGAPKAKRTKPPEKDTEF